MERVFHGWNKYLLWFLLVFALTVAAEASAARASDASTNVVEEAGRHRVSGGSWVIKKNGIGYLRKNGVRLRNGWFSIKHNVYYFDRKGRVKTGSFLYQGNHYYADPGGRLFVKEWLRIGKNFYYYGGDGKRERHGWEKIEGTSYYFDRKDALVTNRWIGNHYVGEDGAVVTSQKVDGRKIDRFGTVKELSRKDRYIIVGASRIEDMCLAVDTNQALFIAERGAGYSWLKNIGGPSLVACLKKDPDYKVLFNLGNNDIRDLEQYLRYYRQLIRRFPETEFYFLDALPGTGDRAKNAVRKAFNRRMEAAFGSACIGGYDYMYQIGFKTVDQVHYPDWVSKKMYAYAVKKMEKHRGA